MDAETLKKYLDKLEQAVGDAEENEADTTELGDRIVDIVNDIREKLRQEG
jgi:predicted transcriptional regulator